MSMYTLPQKTMAKLKTPEIVPSYIYNEILVTCSRLKAMFRFTIKVCLKSEQVRRLFAGTIGYSYSLKPKHFVKQTGYRNSGLCNCFPAMSIVS